MAAAAAPEGAEEAVRGLQEAAGFCLVGLRLDDRDGSVDAVSTSNAGAAVSRFAVSLVHSVASVIKPADAGRVNWSWLNSSKYVGKKKHG